MDHPVVLFLLIVLVVANIITLYALTTQEYHREWRASRRYDVLVGLLNTLQETLMSNNARLTKVLGDINTATNNIAEDLRVLKAKIEAGDVSEETLAGLETAAAALEAVAASTPDAPEEQPEG